MIIEPALADDPSSLTVRQGSVLLRVDVLAADLLRVRLAQDGHLAEDASWVVPDELRFARAPAKRESDASSETLRTSALAVRVDRNSLAMRIEDDRGRTLIDDAPGPPFRLTGTQFSFRKAMHPGERYFALGDKTGPLDRRGGSFVGWNTDQNVTPTADPLYKTIPFVVGAGAEAGSWGLFLDNTWRTTFDFGKREANVLTIGADGGALDYYVVVGAGVKQVVERYTDLTGHPPMIPKWAFGYQQSRYSYMSADEVRGIADRLRRDHFPADVIWLDIGFQDRNRPFTTDPKTYPDLPGLVSKLRRQGIHTVVITDLHIAKLPKQDYAPYDSGVAEDAFIRNADGSMFTGNVWPGQAVFPDFTRAAVRAWWGRLYAGFVKDGVAGFWNDMNEPAVFDVPGKTIPLEAVQRIETPGFEPRRTNQAEAHNLTGMLNSRATVEGLRKLQPDERPFVMTRATFAGGQKWAVTWTGDNDATWAQLKLGVAQTLNLGLSGFAYTAVDVGGFLGAPSADLLTRWFQIQAFMPLFRDHTAEGTPPQEPWVHGAMHEAIRRRYVEERYRLAPYIYALADEAHRTGAPISRPVFYDYPEMLTAPCDASMNFTLGRNLLIAASPTPASAAPYDVCLPQGRWFDYWTGTEAATRTLNTPGGEYQVVTEAPTLDRLPVYVREGAILPRQALVQSLAETPQGPLELDIWPGAECRGALYDDDGHSMAFSHGLFLRQGLACRKVGDGLRLDFDPREGTFQPPWREIGVTIHGWQSPTVAARIAGSVATASVDSSRKLARISLAAPTGAATLHIDP